MEHRYIDYLIYLINCTLNSEIPDAPDDPDTFDISVLLNTARLHHLENFLYPPLSKLRGFSASPIGKIVKEAYMQAITLESTQQIDADLFMDKFEENAIEHMPLKGLIIKNLYPSPDFRQSNDIDIYVPDKYTYDVQKIMDACGCTHESVGFGMHDSYTQGKLVEIEIHRSLMAPEFPELNKVCDEILANRKLSDGYKYRYELSTEDCYLYIVLHAVKHLKHSSIGIRAFLDMKIYLDRYDADMDHAYIDKMLEKAKIKDAEKNMRLLAEHWFGTRRSADKKILAFADLVGTNGSYGTAEQYQEWSKTQNKFVKFLKDFFWPYKYMVRRFRILKKYPFLLPIYWIYRGISGARKGNYLREADKDTNAPEQAEDKQITDIIGLKKTLGIY